MQVQKECGKRFISQSLCSKLRKEHFSEYQIKRRGDSFARCSRCDQLTKMRNVHAYGSPGYNQTTQMLEAHLREQEASRAHYYLSRALACYRPSQVLCIMHDKVDHSKTASPCFAAKNKAVDGLMKLPVSVTGMLAHGHGDRKYAHYSLDLYPADSNQTIGSIARLLRDLENPSKCINPSNLFLGAGTTELYKAILVGSEQCISSIPCKLGEEGTTFTKLPPILHVQLDNCWKDNKSRHIKCFWSLLVAKGIFEEIQVSFMVVGHTHDDVDASFGRWSMKLREKDYPTIPLLMKSYMDLDDEPFIPGLIEEVPDFKSFIIGFISDDDLIGHSKGRQFRFYRDATGWPLMQFKLRCTDPQWRPEQGIKLWKEDEAGKPKLPSGTPRALLPRPMKGQAEIVKGIKGFIQHWKVVGEADATGEFSRHNSSLVQYWSGVKEALEQSEMEAVDVLCMGFWPQTRQSFDVQTLYDVDGALRDEFAEDEHYIGPRSLRPRQSFRVGRDCHAGYFMLVRPATDSNAPIWLGEARSDPILTYGDINQKKIKVQWYKPCVRRRKERTPYENWDTLPNFKWEEDVEYEEQMTSTTSVLTSWKPRGGNRAVAITIPKRHILEALARIAYSIQATPNAPEEASSSDSE